jgi:hypothetical protein
VCRAIRIILTSQHAGRNCRRRAVNKLRAEFTARTLEDAVRYLAAPSPRRDAKRHLKPWEEHLAGVLRASRGRVGAPDVQKLLAERGFRVSLNEIRSSRSALRNRNRPLLKDLSQPDPKLPPLVWDHASEVVVAAAKTISDFSREPRPPTPRPVHRGFKVSRQTFHQLLTARQRIDWKEDANIKKAMGPGGKWWEVDGRPRGLMIPFCNYSLAEYDGYAYRFSGRDTNVLTARLSSIKRASADGSAWRRGAELWLFECFRTLPWREAPFGYLFRTFNSMISSQIQRAVLGLEAARWYYLLRPIRSKTTLPRADVLRLYGVSEIPKEWRTRLLAHSSSVSKAERLWKEKRELKNGKPRFLRKSRKRAIQGTTQANPRH